MPLSLFITVLPLNLVNPLYFADHLTQVIHDLLIIATWYDRGNLTRFRIRNQDR